MTVTEPLDRAPAERVIHLEDTRLRRRERAELVSEGATAATLLTAAFDAYTRGELDGFTVLNAAAGAALAIVVLRGSIAMRRHKATSSTGANIVGVFGGLAGIAEGLHRLHSAHFTYGRPHFALGVATVFAGLLTTTMAMLAERLEKRRALHITPQGVRMRINRFRRFHIPWSDVTELRVSDRDARLVRAHGRDGVVPLARLVNRDEVRDELARAVRERGLPVREA